MTNREDENDSASKAETPSLELAAQKGGLKNLLRGIGEDSPELLTTALGAVLAAKFGPAVGASAFFGTKILHGTLKGDGFRQIAHTLGIFQKQGRIKEDFVETDLGKACFGELLEAIDKSPDPRRIQALKNAFLRIATAPGTSEGERIYQQQLLRLIGTLSSGEIVLLATAYRVGGVNIYNDIEKWITEIAKESGMLDSGLVELSEGPLIEKKLIMPRGLSDKSGVRWGPRNRLTQLGVRVCEFIQEIE